MSNNIVSRLLSQGIQRVKTGTAGLSLEEAKRKYGLSEIVKLASNENPLGPSPKAIEAAKKAAEAMNIYPDQSGLQLRSAIAGTHGVAAEQVLHGNGSSELITFIGQTFLDPGDECVIPQPTYGRYQQITDVVGGRNIFSPLREFKIDLMDVLGKVTPRTKLIFIANPNNPTGDRLKRAEVESFLERLDNEHIVIFDEAYAEYVEEGDFPRTVQYISAGYNVIMLRTFSKAYGMAGSRLGYAISSPEIIEHLNKARAVFNVNRFSQAAGIEALNDTDHLARCRQLIWEEKKYCYEELKKIGVSYLPTSANFIFVNVGVDDGKLHEAMTRRGVIIRPLTPWGYKGFIRITIGSHYQNERMVDCLKKSLEEIEGRRAGAACDGGQ